MSTTIKSEIRVKGQHSTLTQLRVKGFVPAVVYGYGTEAISISVNERDLLKTLRVTGRNGVMKLQLDGKEINVILNDYQENPLKNVIEHADFLAINMSEELEISAQINLIGEAAGVKDGGVIQQPNFEIQLKVKPSDIPDVFDLDVSALNIGDTITVADIRANSKYEIVDEDEYALVTISAPRTEEEPEAEAEADASAEPEAKEAE